VTKLLYDDFDLILLFNDYVLVIVGNLWIYWICFALYLSRVTRWNEVTCIYDHFLIFKCSYFHI